MTMFRFCLRTPLIPFLFFLALIGCDQQNTAQEELKETRLEEIPSSHSLAKEFFSELGAFSTIGPKSVSKANMKRMTVARKNAETVTAVIAPLRSSTTSEISPIRVRKAGDESTYQISKARVLYIPSIGEFYRVDQHFTDPENKTGYLRFTKLGSKVPAVLKLKGGTVTQRIRMPRTKTPSSVIAKSDSSDWSTGECLETAWDGCSEDAECAILCTLTTPQCPVAVVVACAVSANN